MSKNALLSDNALHVLKQRYLQKDKDGHFETPTEMFERVANPICLPNEELRDRILERMINFDFLPNSPTLMNAGTELGQLSACFVVDIPDDLSGIYEAIKETALIFQTGGGVGASFEALRPRGFPVKSTQGVASGPISFMENFNVATETIKQGGKRRGAFMSILSITHPDVEEFINCKDKGDTLSNMNLSVSITDSFMETVKNDEDINLEFGGKISKTISAKTLFDMIVHHAWETGDPGIIFIDRMNENNPGERIRATNPCGEQPLLPYESCNLGSINLSNFVNNGSIDFDDLRQCIRDAVEFLDLIIDKNNFVLPKIAEETRKRRKVGLGVMGFADMLIKQQIPYDEGLDTADQIMRFIHETAKERSEELCNEKGTYPNAPEGETRRNMTLTTIAPTGTISVIANCSSGIEPIFAVAYQRNLEKTIGKKLFEINPVFERIAEEKGFLNERVLAKIANNHGSLKGITEIPKNIQNLFQTSYEIDFRDHVGMQSTFQKYTDSAVSKTINMPHNASVDNVREAYLLAYEQGCKGITIYRDGSKNVQVLETSGVRSLSTAPSPRVRYKDHVAIVRKIETGCGRIYNGVTFDEFGVFENFPLTSGGGCDASQETMGRALSTMFRENIPPEIVVSQFKRIRCNSCIMNKKIKTKSCAEGMGQQIEDYLDPEILKKLVDTQALIHEKMNMQNGSGDDLTKDHLEITKKPSKKCSECGSPLIDDTKCRTCQECGYSQCL